MGPRLPPLVSCCLRVHAVLFIQEWMVWRDARALAHAIESERIQKVDTAWERYQTIANRARMGVSLWSAQSAMRDRLIADADRVINEYRVRRSHGQ
jgi:hypothetical protein